MNELQRFQVYIKPEYIRDAQAYEGDCSAKVHDYLDQDQDKFWFDIEGYMLVLDINADDIDSVIARLRNIYPKASSDVFRIISAPAELVKEHEFSWDMNAKQKETTHDTINGNGH